MKISVIIGAIIFIAFIGFACNKEEEKNDPQVTIATPTIDSIVALNGTDTIAFGGNEHAEIFCYASGGNLDYTWSVDYGDIAILDANKTKIAFTGSICCQGEKEIFCTVENEKGSTTSSLIIFISEP